jgi:hypothetical protein
LEVGPVHIIEAFDKVRKMKETMVESEVTYTLEVAGKFYIIEHVPARV